MFALRIIPPEHSSAPVTLSPSSFFESIDKLDRDEVFKLYKKHGAILFRGYRLNKANFRRLADDFCSGFVRNRAVGRKNLSKDQRLQSVNLGGTMFPFHPEISREPWRPDTIFFGCLKAPKDAPTQLADGTAMVKAMQEETRQTLSTTRLLYQHPTTKENAERWLGIEDATLSALDQAGDSKPFRFEIDDDGNYIRVFTVPCLYKPMFSENLAFGNHILFSRFFHNIRTFPLLEDYSEIPENLCQEMNDLAHKICYTHLWRKGDILMVDNTRFMHGRPEYKEDGKRVIMSQFGYLKNASVDSEDIHNGPWRQTPVWIEEDAS